MPRLGDANAQDEYQLTDAVQVLAGGGWRVETLRTDDPRETLGVNDPADLELARAGKDPGLAGDDARPQ